MIYTVGIGEGGLHSKDYIFSLFCRLPNDFSAVIYTVGVGEGDLLDKHYIYFRILQTTQRLLRGDLHGGGDGGRPRGMGLCLEQVTSNQRGRGEGDADERTWTVPKTMATVEVFPVCLSVCLCVYLSVCLCLCVRQCFCLSA